jgi:hypothetical protein
MDSLQSHDSMNLSARRNRQNHGFLSFWVAPVEVRISSELWIRADDLRLRNRMFALIGCDPHSDLLFCHTYCSMCDEHSPATFQRYRY